jgi:hypothetical protein
MLVDAIREIQVASADDADRRRRRGAKRELKRRLDAWIESVEDVMEHESQTVPQPLLRDITAFMGAFDARLHHSVTRDPQPLHVLDVLFEAQEQV